jgi:AraC-like DNA-binding protein
MIWTLIFFVSISQGLFLLSIIYFRKSSNRIATILISAIVAIIITINADYALTTSHIYRYVPNLHGFSFGIMFLMSPLFYFYTKSILDENFKIDKYFFLHLIPYFIKSVHTVFVFYLIDINEKLAMIDSYQFNQWQVTIGSVISLSIQIIHSTIYLYFTKKLIDTKTKINLGNSLFLIPFEKRKKWLNTLLYSFLAYLITFIFWVIILVNKGYFMYLADYSKTMILSALVYFIAYKYTLDPEMVSPDFLKKYNNQTAISKQSSDEFIEKIKQLMEQENLYLNPNLDINTLAKTLDIPAYQCSRLINDKFDKGFFDFVNMYRIQEIKRRLTDSSFHHFSILGIALQTGFNSKSSFNAAFKKVTGMTPSDYKKENKVVA